MSIDSSQNITVNGNTSLTNIGNHSQDDDSQPHGESYGISETLPSGNDHDQIPLVNPHVEISGPKAFSRLLPFSLLVTLVVLGLIALVIRLYKLKGNLTHTQKYTFNTIITGLILILALSFFVRCLNKCFSLGSDCSLKCYIGGLQVIGKKFSRLGLNPSTI